jgi:hypothetical protein
MTGTFQVSPHGGTRLARTYLRRPSVPPRPRPGPAGAQGGGRPQAATRGARADPPRPDAQPGTPARPPGNPARPGDPTRVPCPVRRAQPSPRTLVGARENQPGPKTPPALGTPAQHPPPCPETPARPGRSQPHLRPPARDAGGEQHCPQPAQLRPPQQWSPGAGPFAASARPLCPAPRGDAPALGCGRRTLRTRAPLRPPPSPRPRPRARARLPTNGKRVSRRGRGQGNKGSLGGAALGLEPRRDRDPALRLDLSWPNSGVLERPVQYPLGLGSAASAHSQTQVCRAES